MVVSNLYSIIHLSHYFADIDECLVTDPQCDHFCENTNGSYACGCSEGYEISNDSRTCKGFNLCALQKREMKTLFIDVDECSSTQNGCQQLCINTDGSYHCNCTEGYVPEENMCLGIKYSAAIYR